MTYKTWDKISDERISKLHPSIQVLVAKFINEVQTKLGITLRVTQGLRTFEEQNEIYAKGRTAPGQIVSNAKGGFSYHNYGLAIDVAEIKNGQVIWDTQWHKIAPIAKSLGFEWGGDFKKLVDKPHFQYTYGYSINELLALKEEGFTSNDYVVLKTNVA